MTSVSRLFALGLTALLCVAAVPPAAAQKQEYVFTSPPREPAAKGQETYGAIADYLTARIGAKFVYRHPNNWLNYMSRMQTDEYDLVFDGPHFISWRIARFQHAPLVKLPGNLDFVVIARTDNTNITEANDLAGRSVCGHAPPNLATLTMQSRFPNPSRQPYIIEVRGFPNIFAAVVERKCEGGVLPTKVYANLNKAENEGVTRVLYQSRPLPHQGFSASTRVPPEVQKAIRDALLAPEAAAPTEAMRTRFAGGQALRSATREEYEGLGYLLKDMWGFELDEALAGTP
jgi:ABC-type phosphate/phosphonate transport system substrate-binding protein